ncbi:MAG: hypothetical protein CMN30_06200, partial [Sandaracinus sp.]|nr:hypothetical protein [Sandaracinus sp.]
FRVAHRKGTRIDEAVAALQQALSTFHLPGRGTDATVRETAPQAPGRAPLELGEGIHHVGIEVAPLWYWAPGDLDYADVTRAYRRLLGPALREAVRSHAAARVPPRSEPDAPPMSVHDFGRSRVAPEATAVDQQIGAIATRYEWLRALTPVGVDRVWAAFEANGFEAEPELHYRPLRVDPDRLRRELINVPVETVPDPTVEALLREKQSEIDRQLSMLAQRGSRGFLYGSLQLYGEVDAGLRQDAEAVLVAVEAHADRESDAVLSVSEVRERAIAELAYYGADHPGFPDEVTIGDDIAAGLMVSHGRLLLARDLVLPAHRMEALLQHEVGTHVVTHYNGSQQPIRQLASGLSSYDALQEGLGVFSEFVAGGLTADRMRVLAMRVFAVGALVDGASFVETFRLLRERGTDARAAFDVTLRVFRGGGLTKDALYLRGLRDLLAYLGEGHELELLYLGKMALRHVPMVQELRRRGVLEPARALPRILRDERYRARIDAARGLRPADLLRENA